MNIKTGTNLVLYIRYTTQPQQQTSPQSKGAVKRFSNQKPKKRSGVAIIMANKIDFKQKSIRRLGEGHFILIKGTIHQDEVTILNEHLCPKYNITYACKRNITKA